MADGTILKKDPFPFNIRSEYSAENNIVRVFEGETGEEIGWYTVSGERERWFGAYPDKFYSLYEMAEAKAAKAAAQEDAFHNDPDLQIGKRGDTPVSDAEEVSAEADDQEAEIEGETEEVEVEASVEPKPLKASEPLLDEGEYEETETEDQEVETETEARPDRIDRRYLGVLSLVNALSRGTPIPSGNMTPAEQVLAELLIAVAEKDLASISFATKGGKCVSWTRPFA